MKCRILYFCYSQLKIEFSSSLGDMDVDIPVVREHDELTLTKSPEPEFTENVLLIKGENKGLAL